MISRVNHSIPSHSAGEQTSGQFAELHDVDRVVRKSLQPTICGNGVVQWKLGRNCALTPKQLFIAMMALSLPSALIGLGFLLMGFDWIAFFSGMEILVIGAVFVSYARSAGDAEWISVSAEHVEIRMRNGTRETRKVFQRGLVTLSMSDRTDGLITLSESGRRIKVGRHVPAHLRGDFFRSVRRAMETY